MKKATKIVISKYRNKINFFVFFSLLLFLNSCSGISKSRKIEKISSEIKIAIDKAINRVKPALVRIHVVTLSYENGRELKRESAGSGVIIDSQGFIITNHHVVGKAKHIVCTLSSKEEIESELIGTDPLADIAVIKLKNEKNINFPYANFGNSDNLKVGDHVLAMGSPLALSQSVTMGIVSNSEMVMPQLFWPFNRFELEGENVGSIVRWIGHDAPIYGGNSGGPLVNLEGDIIGINEIGMGLSGAIPGNLAKKVADDLIQYKEVTRSWIGLEVQPMLKSSQYKKGVLINGTMDNSPASKAGFQSGDVLIKLNGNETNVRFPEELPLFNQFLTNLPVDKKIDAIVLRNDKEIFLEIAPIKREQIKPPIKEMGLWGMTASNLSLIIAYEMKRKNKDGVLVNNIRPGGPCDEAKPAIRPNDIIVEVNGTPVKNLEDIISITEKNISKISSTTSMLVSFDRNMEKYITVVKVGGDKWEDMGKEAKKAWLGINMQVLTNDIANAMNLNGYTGIRITNIFPDSPAQKADLKVGDIVIALDGERINASEPQDIEIFPTLIRQHKIGSTVELTIIRDKKEIKLSVQLGSTPSVIKEMKKYKDKDFEFTVREMTFIDKVDKASMDTSGVLVESVEEGSWAALAHLAVNDIILKANNIPVTNAASMEKIMQDEKKNSENIVFFVQRGIHNVFIELIGKGEKNDSSSKD